MNTKGIHNANKQFMMAAIAYNLKKYLKFEQKRVQSGVKEIYYALETGYFLAFYTIDNSLPPAKESK